MRICACILLLCLAACSKPVKDPPLSIDKMKLVMWDLIKAGEWHLQIIARDSNMIHKKEDVRLYAQVFSVHGLTREQFFNSYKYYQAHPRDFKILVDSIDAYSSREKNAPVFIPGRPGQ